MRPVHLPFLLVLLFGAALGARAQSVRWEPAANGMNNAITLVFENCEPDGPPALPAIPSVTFTSMGRSENVSIVNFEMTRTVA